MFDEASQIVTKIRHRSAPDGIDQLIFLNLYLKEKDRPDNLMVKRTTNNNIFQKNTS